MHRNTWKARERKAAAIFGTKRQRCSGSSGREDETRSDSKHEKLFIEVKSRKGQHAAQTLYDSTKLLAVKEDKTPVLALATKGRPGFLLCVHSNDLREFVRIVAEYTEANPL